MSIAFNPKSKIVGNNELFSGDISGNISLCYQEYDRGYIRNDFNGKSSIAFGISVNPINKKYCIAAYDDGSVIKWNLLNEQLLYTYPRLHTDSVNCVAYSPDGSYFASGSEDGTIILWNAYDNTFIKKILGSRTRCEQRNI